MCSERCLVVDPRVDDHALPRGEPKEEAIASASGLSTEPLTSGPLESATMAKGWSARVLWDPLKEEIEDVREELTIRAVAVFTRSGRQKSIELIEEERMRNESPSMRFGDPPVRDRSHRRCVHRDRS